MSEWVPEENQESHTHSYTHTRHKKMDIAGDQTVPLVLGGTFKAELQECGSGGDGDGGSGRGSSGAGVVVEVVVVCTGVASKGSSAVGDLK